MIVSVFLEGGIDSLSVLAPVGDPLYRRLRPKLAVRDEGLTRLGADDRLAWHPAARGSRSSTARASWPSCRRSATRTRTSRTSPRVTSGRSARSTRTSGPGWLGRWLDQVGRADNPLQGLSLDGRLAPALATGRVPVASVAGPEEYGFWARNVWGAVEERMLEAIGELGAAHAASPDPALAQAGDAAAQSAACARSSRRSRRRRRRSSRPSPTRTSDDDFPRRLKDLAGLLGAGLPIRAVALSGAGEYDTHDNQPEDFSRAEAHGRLAARVPARPRGARPRRPRARARLVRVRPPRRGERLARHRPRGRRCRLPDRLAR